MELTRKYRSPLAQVKHLGSAKHGTTHWLLQRITALMIIPLGVWFFLNLLNHMRSDYDTVMAWFTSPLNLIGLFTTLPLLLSGLSNGLKSLLIGSGVALGIIFLFNPSLLGLNFLLYYIGPVFILVQRGLLSRNVNKDQLEWYPSGLLLANLIAYGIGLIILQSYLTDWTHETAQLQLQFTEQAKKLPSDQQLYYNQMSSMMLSFFPGIMAVSITGLQILLALFAQKILEHKNLNLRPMPRYPRCTASGVFI